MTEVINVGSKARVADKRAKEKAIAEGRFVYIGRRVNDYYGRLLWEESKWHNPDNRNDVPNEVMVESYRQYLLGNADLLSQLGELKGKVLGCWCKPKPCHGDVIVELLERQEEL